MNFKELEISYKDNYKIITFSDKPIKVLTYLPIEEKFSLIMTAIQKSTLNGIINPIRARCFFRLNIMYLYTDLEFDIEDRIDEGTLYDICETTGLFNAIENAIGEDELTALSDLAINTVHRELNYRNTAAAMISSLVDNLPKNVEAAKDIVENFDKDKFQEVLAFANAIKNQG